MSLHGKREHPYLGYVNLRELNSIRSELGGPVERDLNFVADKPRQRSTTWKRQNGHKRRRNPSSRIAASNYTGPESRPNPRRGTCAAATTSPIDRPFLSRLLEGDVHAVGRQVKSQPPGL